MGYTKAQREVKAKQIAMQEGARQASPENAEKAAPAVAEKAAANPTVQKARECQYDIHDLVACLNGTHNYLIYVSKQTKDIYEWHEFGDVVYMELGELITMKRTQRRFFEKNWIMIEDDAVLRFLQVEQFYNTAVTPENFMSLFACTPAEIEKKISGLTGHLKNSIAKKAAELIESGEIDSRRTITALEKSLGVTFPK